MTRWARLTRTGLVAAVAAGSVLATALLWRGQRDPILSQVPIGMLRGSFFDGSQVLAHGRAFLIDDGVIDRVVTMQSSGGYRWGGSSTNPILRQIDTTTGRLQRSVTLNAGAGGGQYVTDLTTQRVFAIDPNAEQITVLDARQGTILAAPPWPTDGTGAPLALTDVNAAVVDPRSGHVFLSMVNTGFMATSASQPTSRQVVVMLDGHTGGVMRVLSFPAGPAIRSSGPYGTASTSYAPTLSLILDPRPGRLDVFDARGRITVVDTAHGRVVWTRRLRTAITEAIMDNRTGRIFGFDASTNPEVVGGRGTPSGYRRVGSVVTIDAATGTMVRRVAGGIGWGYDGEVALDTATRRLFVANGLSNTVGVVDAASGRLVRTVAVGAYPMRVALDVPRRRVLVLTNAGLAFGAGAADRTLVVLDARDGAVLRTIPLGQPASLLAVDSVSGHLVMAASSIQPGPTDPWSWVPSAVRSRIPAIPPPPPVGPSQHVLHTRVLIVDPSGS